MATDRISRNDPCPCGSGNQFKHCCISQGIDRQNRCTTAKDYSVGRDGLPWRFGVIDRKLNEIASSSTAPPTRNWPSACERRKSSIDRGETTLVRNSTPTSELEE